MDYCAASPNCVNSLLSDINLQASHLQVLIALHNHSPCPNLHDAISTVKQTRHDLLTYRYLNQKQMVVNRDWLANTSYPNKIPILP